MLPVSQLRGATVALISPMTQFGREIVIDIPAFRRLCATAIDAGCTGLLVGGTTGQSCTLLQDEILTLTQEACTYGRDYAAQLGRHINVFAGVAANATHEGLALTRKLFAATDVEALLHVTGYYNNPPQEGLRKHFELMADAAAEFGRGIILYNVPSRTKSNLEARTTIELAKHPAILGIKEASGDLAQIRAIAEGTDRRTFAILAGEDDQVVEIMRLGGIGVISASANVWPREFQVMTELAAAGLWNAADELQAALMPCVRAVFAAKNPIPLHYMLDSRVRLPLVELGELEEPTLGRALELIHSAGEILCFPHVGAHFGLSMIETG